MSNKKKKWKDRILSVIRELGLKILIQIIIILIWALLQLINTLIRI